MVRYQIIKKIYELEKERIIKRSGEHMDWVRNLVIISRNSKLCLCLDTKSLNEALLRYNYVMPSVQEIFQNSRKRTLSNLV